MRRQRGESVRKEVRAEGGGVLVDEKKEEKELARSNSNNKNKLP
jgi:hypothetical protein